MGLDQYACVAKRGTITEPTDFTNWSEIHGPYPSFESSIVFEWRKHSDLNGWMKELYLSRGGKEESFNNCPVKVLRTDLIKLCELSHSGSLSPAIGFFWGQSDSGDDERTITFCIEALGILEKGEEDIYYISNY